MDRQRLVFALQGDTSYFKAHRGFGNADLQMVPLGTIALSLELTSIDDLGLAGLSRLTSLRCLDLDSTRITDDALTAIAALPLLEELWLEDTAVTDVGLASLHSCRALKFVSIAYTNVSVAGAAALASAVPGLEVAQ